MFQGGVLWPSENNDERFSVLLTNSAAYMRKAAANLKVFYTKLIHMTSLARAVHRAPSRIFSFKAALLNTPLPLQPVLTRWSTWLHAALYYADYLEDIQKVLYNTLSLALEARDLPLVKAVKIMRGIEENLNQASGSVGTAIVDKFNRVLQRNPGWKVMANETMFPGKRLDTSGEGPTVGILKNEDVKFLMLANSKQMASYKEEEDPFEEIVFDQARLLNTTPKLNTAIRRVSSGKCVLFAKTLGICGVFFGLGLCIAIPGPTFLLPISELQLDVSLMTNIYVARSSGYAVGSIIGGILFDRFNRLFLLFVSLLLTSVFITVIPWCRVLWLLKACMVGLGMSMGFLDTGCNVLCLDLWGRNSAPFMQGLHFSFGLGMFVAPLLAPPFYEPFAINTTVGAIYYTPVTVQPLEHLDNFDNHKIRLKRENYFSKNYSNNTDITLEEGNFIDNFTTLSILNDSITNFQLTSGFVSEGVHQSFSSLVTISTTQKIPKRHKPSKTDSSKLGSKNWENVKVGVLPPEDLVVVSSTSSSVSSKSLEVTFGHLVMAYAVNSDIQLTQSIGSNISVTFWAAFAVMRFASIFFATGLSPTLMLILNLVCCTLGTLILYAWSDHVETALWVGTILLGAGLASMFPTGLLWIERLLHVSNKVAALLVLGVSLGELACPALIRHLMVNDPKVLMHAALFLNTLCIVIFATLWWLSSQLGEKYCAITSDGYQLANQHDEEEDMMDINLTTSSLFSCGSVKVSRGRNTQAIHGSMLSRVNLGRSALVD
uniref:Uncharacterized protein n=1 Tax=Timema monikensis TaxID=170555 RepID=A0A7R9E368_9NEOP|nr:unnamed protein product [Timema monikensis]